MKEIILAFGKLGLISFGGPVAHIGYLREEFVARRKWVSDEVFSDLVALCQFLPGPASSQTVFGLGLIRGGLAGGILAALFFTLPSAVAMILFAYGMLAWSGSLSGGWLPGLKIAAVAVVANAVVEMARNLCPDRLRLSIAIGSAIIAIASGGVGGQIAAMLAGAALGWMFCRHDVRMPSPTAPRAKSRLAVLAIVAFFILLAGLPVLAASTPSHFLDLFAEFYRVGAMVFGGGHVVLPLLQGPLVPSQLSSDEFLAGYGFAQALPGPLFSFAGYVGTLLGPGWLGGCVCLVAIFLPGFLLTGGTWPSWQRLRNFAATQAALRGINAAVVGVLLAAFYDPVWRQGVTSPAAFCLALAGWLMLAVWKLPPWLVVILCAGGGQLILPAYATP